MLKSSPTPARKQRKDACEQVGRLARYADAEIVADPGPIGRERNRIGKAAPGIDQPVVKRADAGPYPAAADTVHLCFSQVASFGYMLDKPCIDSLDIVLQIIPLGGGYLPERKPYIGRRIGLGDIHRNAEFILQSLPGIEQQPEYPDRPGDRSGRGKDHISRTRDIISPRCGHVTHRNDDRLFRTEQFHLMPDHLRSKRTAPGRVDPQHHGLDLLIPAQIGQFRRKRLAAHLTFRSLSVHNIAFGIEHGDPVAGSFTTAAADLTLHHIIFQRNESGLLLPCHPGQHCLHISAVSE